MTKSEVKTFIKIYKTASSAIEQLLQQFSTSVASGIGDYSSSMGQRTSHGETIFYDVPAIGELGQVPRWKRESLSHWIWF